MTRSSLIAVCIMVVLVGPGGASGEIARTYDILWNAECELLRLEEHGAVQGHGLATLTPVAGGWELRFGGPAGASGVTFVTGDGTALMQFPNPGCPSLGYLEGVAPVNVLGSLADPAGFTVGFMWGSMGQMERASASALETTVAASITGPVAGGPVIGTTPVTLSVTGPLPGVGVTLHLALDGQELATLPVTMDATRKATATYSWNTAAVAAGGHRLDLTVTGPMGVVVATSTMTTSVAKGDGQAGPAPVQVLFTAPKANATVSGTVWFSVWVEGAAPGTNAFTATDNGTTFDSRSCACTHIVPALDTRRLPNGTHAIKVTVRDSAGRIGTGTVNLLVNN